VIQRPVRRTLWGTALTVAVAVVPLAACGGGGGGAKASSTSTSAPGSIASNGGSSTSSAPGATSTGPGTAATTPGGSTAPGGSTTAPGTGSANDPGNATGSTSGNGSGSTAGPATTVPRKTTTTTQPSSGSGAPATDAQLDAAYAAGYRGLCRQVWSHSTDGKLYEPDDTTTSYTISDCLNELDVTYRYSTTLTAATAEGRQDATDDLFGTGYSGYFCWLDDAQNIGGCFNADKGTYGPPPPP
jgi:hypothetical protein